MTVHPEGILGSPGQFEMCPDWVPAMDGRRRYTPIILKILAADRFDHSASWPAKVRNVSRLGSQILKLQPGFECNPHKLELWLQRIHLMPDKNQSPTPELRQAQHRGRSWTGHC
jgi:hypothetical protein